VGFGALNRIQIDKRDVNIFLIKMNYQRMIFLFLPGEEVYNFCKENIVK